MARLDDELWERVGRLLVARRRIGRRELDSAVAEQHRTLRPLDEILVERGLPRPVVASAVLVAQLGDELHGQLRARKSLPDDALRDVPAEPRWLFVAASLVVDVAVLALAVAISDAARRTSPVPLLPAGWIALFAALALSLYWAWRISTFRTKLRPWADAFLIAGSTSLAGLIVLTLRSLDGTSGVAESLLPLWAFATVYGVCGRAALYLAWPAWKTAAPDPVRAPLQHAEQQRTEMPQARTLELVPVPPELSNLLDELQDELDEAVDHSALAS